MELTKEQKEAVESFGQDILVSAGAGSGKTEVLSLRVLYLIMQKKISISRMLILTFTENAAASMKARIKKKLLAESKGNQKLEEEALKVDSSDITTIDAFNRKIVKKYFYRLGIKEDFDIVNQSLLYGKIYSLINEEFEERFDSDVNSSFYKMLDKFTLKNPNVIKDLLFKMINEMGKSEDPVSDIKGFIDNPQKKLSELNLIYSYLAADYKKEIKEFRDSLFLNCSEDETCFAKIKVLVRTYFSSIEKMDSVEEIIDAYEGFKKSKPRKGRGDSSYYGTYKKKMAHLNKSMDKAKRIPSFKKIRKNYEDNNDLLICLYQMALNVFGRFKKYKDDNGIYDFSDIANMALKLLTDSEDIRNEVALSYDEIMVDEYQDNSDAQEKLFSLLDRGDVFMVGDVKQSIYAFRGANPTNFMKRFDNYSKGLGGKLISMNNNFRSTKSVLTDVNNIFSKIMSSDFGGADYHRYHLINAANQNLAAADSLVTTAYTYQVDSAAKRSPNIVYEANIIADSIISRINNKEPIGPKKTPAQFSDFCILCDRGSEFDKLAKVFLEKHIPLTIEVNSDISDQPVIQLVKSLFSLYASIGRNDYSSSLFKHSLLTIIRGPLGRYSEEEISDLYSQGSFAKDKTVNKMRDIYFMTYKEDILSIYQAIIDGFSVYSAVKDFSNPSSSYSFLTAYISIVQGMAKLNYSIYDALDYFKFLADNTNIKDQLQLSSGDKNAVVLTNIHKSKGLEYPIVYYIGLSKKYNESESREKFSFYKDYGIILPFTNADLTGEDEKSRDIPISPFKLYMDSRQMMSQREEKVRLLYVAMTRPQYQMNLLVRKEEDTDPCLEPKEAVSLLDLLTASGFKCLTKNIARDKMGLLNFAEDSQEEPKKIACFDYYTFEMPAEDSGNSRRRASKLITHMNQKTLDFGTYLHKCLEAVSLKDRDTSFISDIKARKLVDNFLDSSLLSRFAGYDDYHEYSFIDPKTHRKGSIDLLLVSDKEAIVIDYKLKNIDDEDYKLQLMTYAKNVERIFSIPCKCFIYSIIESKYDEF